MTQPVPPEITQVDGCNCGGHTMHRTDCALFDLPPETARRAINEAQDRVDTWVARLNHTQCLWHAKGEPARCTRDRVGPEYCEAHQRVANMLAQYAYLTTGQGPAVPPFREPT